MASSPPETRPCNLAWRALALWDGDVFSRLYSCGVGLACCGSVGTREHQQSGAHSQGRSMVVALSPLSLERAKP